MGWIESHSSAGEQRARELTQLSVDEAGVNADVERRFPGAEVHYGSEATTGAGDNKPIPEHEGGVRDDRGR